MGARQILRPQAATEAVVSAVGDGQRLVVVGERRHGDERAEHLFLTDSVARLGANDGRFDVATVGERRVGGRLTAGDDLASLVEGNLDVAEDAVAVHR